MFIVYKTQSVFLPHTYLFKVRPFCTSPCTFIVQINSQLFLLLYIKIFPSSLTLNFILLYFHLCHPAGILIHFQLLYFRSLSASPFPYCPFAATQIPPTLNVSLCCGHHYLCAAVTVTFVLLSPLHLCCCHRYICAAVTVTFVLLSPLPLCCCHRYIP